MENTKDIKVITLSSREKPKLYIKKKHGLNERKHSETIDTKNQTRPWVNGYIQ